jgi:hypothetical protein
MLAYESQHVLSDATLGWHDCEICRHRDQRYPGGIIGPVVHWRERDLRLYGHGQYLVRKENVVYMAPALLLHCILDHHYRPPDAFVEAVVVGSFLTADDLRFVEDEGVRQ